MTFVSRLAGLFFLFVPMLFSQSQGKIQNPPPASEQKPSTPDGLSPALFPTCKSYAYTPVPRPDVIADLMNQRKQYRLVIGVGEFNDGVTPPLEFVRPTVARIDKELAQLHFASLPKLRDSPLTGSAATKDAIVDALKEMEKLLTPEDLGIIYYIGHGIPTLDNKDLSLAVFDRPVGPTDGLRFSDILGIFENSETLKQISQIPHLIIVLDTCFSGNVAMGPSIEVATKNGVQRVIAIENAIVPEKITLLTATADGDNVKSFELTGPKESAYGYFFARALSDDWKCADVDSPDGIMTVEELNVYLTERLTLAHDNNEMQGSMTPQILEREKKVFLAYSPEYHAVDGARDEIVKLNFKPKLGQMARISFAGGRPYECDAASECIIPVSTDFQGPVTVTSYIPSGGVIGIAPIPDKILEVETATVAQILAHKGSIAGVSVLAVPEISLKKTPLAKLPNLNPRPDSF